MGSVGSGFLDAKSTTTVFGGVACATPFDYPWTMNEKIVIRPKTEKTCGSCSMCCKVFSIEVLNKPVATWCRNCNIGAGCGIYEDRPDVCRGFRCVWLDDPNMPEEFRPDRSKMILVVENVTGSIYAHMDRDSPNIWRRSPYIDVLKDWARRLEPLDRVVAVIVGPNCVIVKPDGSLETVTMKPGARSFDIRWYATPAGRTVRVEPTT